jgi:hypothetical protein
MAEGIAYAWGTTAEERALPFPDDRSDDAGSALLWRGVSIAAPPAIVFRWLCQLREAPYSYDWIDNGGRQSPRALTSGLEQLAAGQIVMSIFRLEAFEAPVHITVATPAGGRGANLFGVLRVTYWVRPEAPGLARLLVKLRIAPAPGWHVRLRNAALAWGDLVMMRRQLLNLKALAEAQARGRMSIAPEAPPPA